MKYAPVAIALAAVSAAPATDQRGMDDVDRLNLEAYKNRIAQQRDSFAADAVEAKLEGRSFTWSAPLKNGRALGDPSSQPFYSYENGSLTLSIGPHYDPKLTVVTRRPERVKSSSYVGQNTFGAKAQVVAATTLAKGLALVDGPKGETESIYGGNSPYQFDYWYRATLDGQSAKAIALDADLSIEGTFTKLANGKLADCSSSFRGATVASPTEIGSIQCFAGVRVTRIAFVHRSSGAVIKEWRR
jgi:hypothetical protein